MRRAFSWLVAVRARPLTYPTYLLWRDVVEIDGQCHRFKGALRRFRSEQALLDYFGGTRVHAVAASRTNARD